MTLRDHTGGGLPHRVEIASGPDRDLDRKAWLAAGGTIKKGTASERWIDKDGVWWRCETYFTQSEHDACQLLPWKEHPCATFNLKVVQDGSRGFWCWAEFTWPSTECSGRARTPALAITACALRAIQRTNDDLAPFRARSTLKAEGGRLALSQSLDAGEEG